MVPPSKFHVIALLTVGVREGWERIPRSPNKGPFLLKGLPPPVLGSAWCLTWLICPIATKRRYLMDYKHSVPRPLLRKMILKLYYTHFEITGDPCNLIGSQQCDLFPNCIIFALNCILIFSPSKWKWSNKNIILILTIKLYDFKIGVIKW